ncbi:MAG: response regulator, partial [Acidobacteriaceae bacterium]|nr:response regulator [Acidobacteriaceae bacterium]
MSTAQIKAGTAGTVLMVEDETTLRVAVACMLRRRGFSVIEAEDGLAGVDLYLAHQTEVELVLLDVNLPGMSGLDVLKTLVGIRPDVKVILTSACSKDILASTTGDG